MKTVVNSLIFLFFSLSYSYSQEINVDSVYSDLDEFVVNRRFFNAYQREVERVRKIYPMAIKAKAIIDEYEKEVATMSKKREAKKYSKKMNAYLKDEFTYSIRDLYTSEGRLLMELVHRETGKTVDQIITEYAGPTQAFIYRNMAKMFDQDLRTKYNKDKQNYFTEMVINDILNGDLEFNPVMDKMTKEAFKLSQQQYRQEKKEMRQHSKEYRALKKKTEKETKKKEKASKKAK